MTRDWNKLNIRDAYKPVPQEFDQAVSKTIRGIRIGEAKQETASGAVFRCRRMLFIAAICALLMGMVVAYAAVTKPAILNWLLGNQDARGYQDANEALEQSAQTVVMRMKLWSNPLKQLLRKTAPIISPSELTALSMTAISLHFPTSWKTTSPINLQWSQLIAARLSTGKNWGWMSVIMLSGLCQIPTRMFFLFREILRMAVPGACQSVRR